MAHAWLPPITGTCCPWTRWWWMGSAMDEAEITRQLELFHAAGFGGVEISPVYGVSGAADRFIAFLSPRWVDLLRYTVREARRLGMDVDLISGTGWPLGGPWVSTADAAARLTCDVYPLNAGEQLAQPISTAAPHATLHALIAFAHDGQIVDLLGQVDAQHRLHWIAPAGQWTIYAVFGSPTGQQVKRAAPDGEGNVVDHFNRGAISRYLKHFDHAFADLAATDHPRCMFNDSYEVYEANWTGDVLPHFTQRRGYDLRHYLPALLGRDQPDIVSRVRSDYRQTLAELLLEAFVQPWTAWAHRHESLSRNQAHGSPGHLIDLYAAADVPETETFGPDWLRFAHLAPLPGIAPQQGGRAHILGGKIAASAAHIGGKALCSSEAFTWLGEHGKVPLAHMKAEMDVMFVMGINHVFFHGTPHSPADAPWPGWMFYASTHVAPTNPLWRDLPALNAYISRCQSVLQAGIPDNDLLVYFPIFDLWASDHGAEHMLHFLTPHNTDHWLDENVPAFAAATEWLWDRGYSFDVVSDQLLQTLHVADQQIAATNTSYRALVVAGCQRMPPETLQRLIDLVRAGATLIVLDALPVDVPGLGDLDQRRQRLRTALSQLVFHPSIDPDIEEAQLGQGRVLVGPEMGAMLRLLNVRREAAVDAGAEVIRRRDEQGYLYFMVNWGQQRLDQWIRLPIEAAAVITIYPLTNLHGVAHTQPADRATLVYLQLEPGESVLLRTLDRAVDAEPWLYWSPVGVPQPINGPWQIAFVEGGPTLPAPSTLDQLASWTECPGDREALQAFAGTARFATTFDRPQPSADAWTLDLGDVAYSARVYLNGHELGTCFAHPFRIMVSNELLANSNVLEIEVTNLMANRLAYLDRQRQAWRPFFFVDSAYHEFNAANWEPLPSGLLGPVQLMPLRTFDQAQHEAPSGSAQG